MDALSRWVVTFALNSTWQLALVVGVAALADLALRRAPARYRHAIWVAALSAAVVLPAVSTRTFEVPRASASATADIFSLPTVPLHGVANSSVVVRASAHHTRLALARSVLIVMSRPMMRALLVLYSAFLVFALTRFLRAWLRARRVRRLADARPLPSHVLSAVEHCRRAIAGVRWPRDTNLAVLWSDKIPGPVTVGALRGAIILPEGLLEEDSREDLEAALAHEMAHVCRCDYLWNLVCELLLVPVAFHPLARLARRRLAEARELACDELATRVLDPSRYARSLVSIANAISRRTSAAFKLDYTLGVFDANILEERVMTLLKPRASGRLARVSVLLGTLVIASSCLLASRFSFGVGEGSSTSSGATARAGNQVTNYSGTLKGVSGGISGGVSGGVTGGVAAGVSGGPTNNGYSLKASASPEREEPGQSETSGKTARLSGIIVDASGARIPKAEVRLVSRNNSFTQTTESGDTGGFSFDGIPVGRYALEVSSPGMGGSFRSFELRAEGQPPFFPFVLHPGSVTESAVVTAKAPGSPLKAAAVGPRKIRIGGNIQGAKLIDGAQAPPVYPESARAAGLQGDVLLQAEISPEGVPENLKVIGSPGDDLSKAALQAVSQWRYQPTLLNGEPVAVVTTITVDFRLED